MSQRLHQIGRVKTIEAGLHETALFGGLEGSDASICVALFHLWSIDKWVFSIR
jgi:hypothetical protein